MKLYRFLTLFFIFHCSWKLNNIFFGSTFQNYIVRQDKTKNYSTYKANVKLHKKKIEDKKLQGVPTCSFIFTKDKNVQEKKNFYAVIIL